MSQKLQIIDEYKIMPQFADKTNITNIIKISNIQNQQNYPKLHKKGRKHLIKRVKKTKISTAVKNQHLLLLRPSFFISGARVYMTGIMIASISTITFKTSQSHSVLNPKIRFMLNEHCSCACSCENLIKIWTRIRSSIKKDLILILN